jgi:haloalkane dehalogenase
MSIASVELPKKQIDVLGKRMAYVELGSGDPIVFQHGNPTSSYLWRNIMPRLADQGRCIALDLIGMGDSEKLDPAGPGSYRFSDHQRYFEAALLALGVDDRVTLVGHDWGSALSFDWARRHPDKVLGIAYMEALVRSLSWDEWPDEARQVFQALRSDAGDEMVLEKNVFVERILPGSVLRDLGDEEMTVYRRPYLSAGEDRRPTLSWPRELPIDDEPADVVAIVNEYAEWMTGNELPKLFINGDPGAILVGERREFCRSWKNQTEVTVKGSHFIQEDSPEEIAEALAGWREPLT